MRLLLVAALVFVVALPCAAAASSLTPADDFAWLSNYTNYVLKSCRVLTTDGTGTVLYSPNGGKPYYVGQWFRDSYYGFSGAWSEIPDPEEAATSAAYILQRIQPGTNFMPQFVVPTGAGVYGQWGAPTALDCGPFAGLMLDFFAAGEGASAPGAGAPFLAAHGPAVVAGMLATPMRNGLPWSDPAQPCVGYGFTDCEIKTENEMYSSVLLWDAAGRLAADFTAAGNASAAASMRALKAGVEANFSASFWNERIGMFMAATGIESDRVDVWGSAYASLVGLATPAQASRVVAFLVANEASIFYAGQVREIPLPGAWDKLFNGCGYPNPGEYQNGGFWGTPSYHVLGLLGANGQKPFACAQLAAAIANFRAHDAWEWIGLGAAQGSGAPLYVATVASTLRAAAALQCWL